MVHLDNSSRPHAHLLCREDIAISFSARFFLLMRGYFFWCEVLSFDARLFLLPLQLWATVTEHHKWYSNKNFVPFPSLPDWKKLCKPSLIEPQARTNVNECVTEGPVSYLFFFPIAQFLLFKRCRKKSIPQAGVIFHCQWNISKANHIS